MHFVLILPFKYCLGKLSLSEFVHIFTRVLSPLGWRGASRGRFAFNYPKYLPRRNHHNIESPPWVLRCILQRDRLVGGCRTQCDLL